VALGNFLPYTPGSDTVKLHKDHGAAVNTVAVQIGGCCGRMRAFWKIPKLFNTGKFQNFSILFYLPRSWLCHLSSSSLLVLCPYFFFFFLSFFLSSPVLEALLEWFLWNGGLLRQRFFFGCSQQTQNINLSVWIPALGRDGCLLVRDLASPEVVGQMWSHALRESWISSEEYAGALCWWSINFFSLHELGFFFLRPLADI